MFRPFADPLLVAAECRLSPLRLSPSPRVSQAHAFPKLTPATRPNKPRFFCEIGRTLNLRQSAAKLDVLSRSCSPLADQLWRSPPLVTRGHVEDRSRTAPNR